MKKATVLKSMRTVEGAEQYLKVFKNKFPEGAVVIKGMSGFDYDGPSVDYPSGGQIVIYEGLDSTTSAIKEGEVEDFVRALLDKDLVEISSGGLNVSAKLYDLLYEFNKKAFAKYLKKSIDASGALAQSLEKQDVEGGEKKDEEDEKEEIHKSLVSIIKAMSESEASNIGQGNVGISDSEAFKDTKNKFPHPSQPAQPKTDGPAPEGDLSQEDASNLKGDTRTTSISDKYPVDSENDIANNTHKSVFKSLNEARAWQNQNREFEIRETTFEERLELGRRYMYTADAKTPKGEVTPFGNRRVRK